MGRGGPQDLWAMAPAGLCRTNQVPQECHASESAMPAKHVVVQGECLVSIAEQHGFAPQTLWEAAENSELRNVRRSPNILFPGDVLHIPDKRPRSVAVAAGARHVFRRRGVPAHLQLRFLQDGEPRAGVAYRLILGSRELTGTTSPEGLLEQWIPAGVREGRLILAEDEVYELHFGHLDPLTTESGVRARLHNLGYLSSLDAPGKDLQTALEIFQAESGLPITGSCDEETSSRLLLAHGS